VTALVKSVEAFLLLLDGQAGLAQAGGFLLRTLVGNIIGGIALFSLLAQRQVREEIDWPRKCWIMVLHNPRIVLQGKPEDT
jgi:hypothetical protein